MLSRRWQYQLFSEKRCHRKHNFAPRLVVIWKILKSDAPQSLANSGFVRNHLSGDAEKIFWQDVSAQKNYSFGKYWLRAIWFENVNRLGNRTFVVLRTFWKSFKVFTRGAVANQTLSNLIGKVLQLGIKVCREFYLLPLDMNPSHQARYQQKGGRVLGRRFGR